MTQVTEAVAQPRTDTAWSNRDFRRLWLGSAVSSFGSEVAELALPLLALVTLSASAAEVGLLRVAQFLPFLLATLPLGYSSTGTTDGACGSWWAPTSADSR
ncbi:hypothetical protein Pflav_028810 [Phytohabitans flavus]|uniref:Major facilitator superfamily (MFS) profile domain-containing protein n=1 Tax=Phytohabitans flavus TaxID=1076124 RepID=A0A6F8XRU8_9ACTN|nr:MFS transporter [Phytohabitans flavus]BCB76471.1 hypothetical protein Pflav_028810 [Phytohabitans flavus]